jgi:hypothetical protein
MEEITICITTFKRRLPLFKNLVDNIKKFYPDIEILVAINGEYKESVDNNYRKEILSYISSKKNVIPIMYTEFRSLAKLWNNLVIFSKTNYNLILNDDLSFDNGKLIECIQDVIEKTNLGLFTLNRSWSHFVVSKIELDKIGYFDERLLAIGEEDGDILWRYQEKYNKSVFTVNINGIKNLACDYDIAPTNMDTHVDNKPKFNAIFAKEYKYKLDKNGINGIFGAPYARVLSDDKQYPYEMFYLKNKENIKDGKNINLCQ